MSPKHGSPRGGGNSPQREGAVKRKKLPVTSALSVLAVAFAAGLLFGVSAYSARSHGNPSEMNMAGLVREQQQVVLDLEETVDQMRLDQEGFIADSSPLVSSAALELRGELVGPGVTVTLDDSPADFVLDSAASVNAAVVHQQDVDAVMNALWSGGAEAMSVQGVRVTFSTPVRCVGNVILVGARSYAPPYRITAIGNVDKMLAALDADPSVRLYREDTVRYQLGWDVQVYDSATIPAASDLSPLQYATLPERA